MIYAEHPAKHCTCCSFPGLIPGGGISWQLKECKLPRQQQIYPSHEQNQTNSYISSARQGYPHNECGEGVHTVCLWVLCHPLFPQTQAFTKLLSMPDVLAAWQIGTQTLRRWNHKGKFSLLPTSKSGDLSSIFSFLQSRRKVQLHQPSQVRGYSC